jgi:hypothetical protein
MSLRRHALLVLVTLVAVAYAAPDTEPQLVVIADARSPLTTIPIGEVRKLFLGVPLVFNNVEVVPVLNQSDPQLVEAFLQKVLFMSATVYERRMVGKVYREGGARIAEVHSREELVRVLAADRRRVSYALRDALPPGVKIVSEP